MKENTNFYKPNEIKGLYPEITRVYQKAFGGEPWFEVSKCADSNDIKRCVGGFSKLKESSTCELCLNKTELPAYDIEELTDKFKTLASTRPTSWYIEEGDAGVQLAALAWCAKPEKIFNEKYSDVPEMAGWMEKKIGTNKIVWLDEVFANREKKPDGNLWNFRVMCNGFSKQFNNNILAFRTINPRMISTVERAYGKYESAVYRANIDVPDRRDFVIIKQFGGPELPSNGCGR